MGKLKKILVPTDFSEPAENALKYAIAVAGEMDSSITLYHCYTNFLGPLFPKEEIARDSEEQSERATEELLRLKEKYIPKFGGPIDIYVDSGKECERLRKFAENRDIDLIIMGTTGASGLKKTLMGSFTSCVMRNTTKPVLAIPRNYTYREPSIIAYAANYNEKELQCLDWLYDVAVVFQAEIKVFHISESGSSPSSMAGLNSFKEEVLKRTGSVNISFDAVEGEDISDALLKFTSESQVDWLALTPVKRKGWNDVLFHKSITKEVASRACIPLLAIPPDDQ